VDFFARRLVRAENKTKPGPDDVYYCHACENFSEISKVKIPYAFMLVLQELKCMNMASRIK